MATEILRPQDILIERFRLPPSSAAFHRRRSHVNRRPVVKTERFEKKKPSIAKRFASSDDLRNGSLVMGRVTILRRGESFDSLCGSGQSEMVPKQIRVGLSPSDVYAGSAISNSPSPRALPLPSFFNKKQENFKSFDDSATRDLRRLLRLEY